MRGLQAAEPVWGLNLGYHQQCGNTHDRFGEVKPVLPSSRWRCRRWWALVSAAIAGREQSWYMREFHLGLDWCLGRIQAVRYLGGVCERELGIRWARCGEDLDSGAPPRRISVGCRSVGCNWGRVECGKACRGNNKNHRAAIGETWNVALSPVFGAINRQKIVIVWLGNFLRYLSGSRLKLPGRRGGDCNVWVRRTKFLSPYGDEQGLRCYIFALLPIPSLFHGDKSLTS